MPDILPDHEKLLLKQIAEGNEQAFTQVFHAYRDKLFVFIFRMSGSKEIAEDVVQDVFLKIWLQRDKLSTIEHFNAFVFRVTQNHAINQLKHLSKETLVLMKTQTQTHSTTSTPDEQIIFNNMRHSLNKIVEDLPPRQKKIYQLSREQHMKQEDIAKQLDLSISTIQNHMTQALRTIREKLKKYTT